MFSGPMECLRIPPALTTQPIGAVAMVGDNVFSSTQDVKSCSKCGQPRHEFRKKRNLCVECHKEYHRQYYKKHKARFNSNARAYHLKTKYDINQSKLDEMLEAQGGKCAICRKPPNCGRYKGLNVDHDHRSGKIRGLLCWSCNAGLGHLGDDIRGIRRALSYLSRGIP